MDQLECLINGYTDLLLEMNYQLYNYLYQG